MKKTLFFTILFSILSVSMFGQLNISLHAKESNGINCGNTITRCYDSDHDVTTYFKGGKTYIDLVEISTQFVYNIDIMSDIEITDMYVFKEKLFFCGRDSQRHWGIVGYLDIPDMQLLMPVTVKYFYVYNVYNLNKLVVNDELGPFHVSAIGQDLWPNQSSLYYNNLFVDIPDITTTGYDVYYFDYYEHYYDLLLTEKFIVCCGYDTDPSVQSICYRKTERFNISTCPLFDSIHYFAGGDDAYSMTHSTSLDTNRIAMSYFYMSGPTSYTRIRTIDVMYSIMTNSYEFVLPDKGEPKHLAFIPANRNLVVMQDFAYAGTYNSNFIQFNPFINYPPGIIEYKPAKIFQHLTEHYFKYYLASLGSEWFWKEGSAAPTGYPDADCPDENIMEIKETQTLRHHVIYNNITPVSNTGNIVPMPHDDNLYRVSIECTNQ